MYEDKRWWCCSNTERGSGVEVSCAEAGSYQIQITSTKSPNLIGKMYGGRGNFPSLQGGLQCSENPSLECCHSPAMSWTYDVDRAMNTSAKMNTSDHSPQMSKGTIWGGRGGLQPIRRIPTPICHRSGLEESRPSLDSAHLHSMYPAHSNRTSSTSSNSPPAPPTTTTSSSMLVVPQPINAAKANGRKYQCKMCPQIFASKSQMQQHAREIHRGDPKPHQCRHCMKSFASSHQLIQHLRVHSGEKPYKCSYCDRAFKQLSHVQQHSRLHTGERPYKCTMPNCDRAFIQLSNLQQHLRNHDSQVERARNKLFRCQICFRSFTTESSMNTHIGKQHSELGKTSQDPNTPSTAFVDPAKQRKQGEHPCPICGKTYVNEGSLRKHIAKHPESVASSSTLRMWPCTVCQSVFTQEAGLLRHMEDNRTDPKHQFAAQYILSRAAIERRERGIQGPDLLSHPHTVSH